MPYRSEIQIQCHCGNITLEFRSNQLPEELPLRRCLCSFCVAHGGIYTSDPNGEVEISFAKADEIHHYRNPHSVSEQNMNFTVCRICGTVPLATSEIEGKDYAVVAVNGRCSPQLLPGVVVDMDYDDETLAIRNERRKRSWISRSAAENPAWLRRDMSTRPVQPESLDKSTDLPTFSVCTGHTLPYVSPIPGFSATLLGSCRPVHA